MFSVHSLYYQKGGVCLFHETLTNITEAAIAKKIFLQSNRHGYFLQTLFGGLFIGFGMILLVTIGGLLDPVAEPSMKIIQGISFGVALSMVMMAGADLFTGNNLVMAIGALSGRTSWGDAVSIWSFSFVGNFIGSIICAWLFFMTGLADGVTGTYVEKIAELKVSATFIELLFRGVLCNILVCLAVWSAYKLKSETAKLMMIFSCIFPFITSGFEHCVANMTLFSLALMIPGGEPVTMVNMWGNLIPVTIGNVIGGALCVGAIYYYSARK